MITHYTEYKCPECGESWILSMSNYKEKTNQAILNDFHEHVKKHELEEAYIEGIKYTLSLMNGYKVNA